MPLCRKVLAFAVLSGLAQAHLKISSPVPYNEETLDNSPLVNAKPGSSGSNFPCKVTSGGSYTITTENEMNVGEDQTLSFIGSASHGGGTCQLALTTSREPGPTDEWKVFQIFEGGCPINGDGNDGTSNFTYSIPSSIKNGQYSFSWMWYNRIGNREIYMNCAPITVKGSSASDMSGYNALPNAYVINLPTSECSTVEGTNQEIPFVGSAEIKKDSTYSMAAASGPSCAASAAAMTKGGAGSGTAAASAMSAPSSSAAASASSAGAYSAPASSAEAATSASGGYQLAQRLPLVSSPYLPLPALAQAQLQLLPQLMQCPLPLLQQATAETPRPHHPPVAVAPLPVAATASLATPRERNMDKMWRV